MHASTTNLYPKTVFKVYSDLRYNGEVVHTTQEEAQGLRKTGELSRRGEISKYHMSIGS